MPAWQQGPLVSLVSLLRGICPDASLTWMPRLSDHWRCPWGTGSLFSSLGIYNRGITFSIFWSGEFFSNKIVQMLLRLWYRCSPWGTSIKDKGMRSFCYYCYCCCYYYYYSSAFWNPTTSWNKASAVAPGFVEGWATELHPISTS